VKTVLAPLLPAAWRAWISRQAPLPPPPLHPRDDPPLALELLPRICCFPGQRWVWLPRRGSLRAEGSFQDWLHGKASLLGRIRGRASREPPLAVRRFRFDAPLAGRIAAPTLPGCTLSVGAGEMTYEGRPLPLGTLGLRAPSGRSILPGAWKTWTSDPVPWALDGCARLPRRGPPRRLDGRVCPRQPGGPRAALSGREWDGCRLRGNRPRRQVQPAVGGSRIGVTATLGQIGFTSPAGDVMGQNLAGRVDLEALLIPQPRVKTDLVLHRGRPSGHGVRRLRQGPLDLHVGGTRLRAEEYKDLLLEGGSAGFGRLNIEGRRALPEENGATRGASQYATRGSGRSSGRS